MKKNRLDLMNYEDRQTLKLISKLEKNKTKFDINELIENRKKQIMFKKNA